MNHSKSEPIVSVLMTVYNRENYIKEAIKSVLASNLTNFELIIVDDVSNDKSYEIASAFAEIDDRIRLFRNETNLGDYPNRNRAASYASGKYLKYLDSDDYIYPHSINFMVEAMEKSPEAAFGFSYRFQHHLQGPFPIQYTPTAAYKEHFFGGGYFYSGPGSSIIRRDKFIHVGGFSGKRYVGDFELWLKLSCIWSSIVLPPSLIWWRQHEGQEHDLGHQNAIYLEANYLLVKEILNTEPVPLSEVEIKKIRFDQKKMLVRGLYKLLFQQRRLKRFYAICSSTKIEWYFFLISLLPIGKIKSFLQWVK